MTEELIELTRKLLQSIEQGDWKAYTELCDTTLTCFEPEAQGHLVSGMAFHRYYFDLPRSDSPTNVTISSPNVRMLGDSAAVVSYTRLVQSVRGGQPVTQSFEETRIWEKQGDQWKHVHFHRSRPAKPVPERWLKHRN